jgi:TRAP-type mannitol/chloroaromatic compound transport system substrate-binding protein
MMEKVRSGWDDFVASANGLLGSDKEALTFACLEANSWVSTKYDASNTAALKRLAGQGAVLQPFSQEVMDGCYRAAQELYAELNQKNPAFKKVYDSYKAFQDDG